jgi:hypothetical protein
VNCGKRLQARDASGRHDAAAACAISGAGRAHLLLCSRDMVLLRCAWHRQYWNFPKLYGVLSWRGRYLAFSDGMCRRCSQRWREDWRAVWDDESASPLVPSWLPRLGIVIVLLAATILSARPLNQSLPLPIPLRFVSGVGAWPPIEPVDPAASVRGATAGADQPQPASVTRAGLQSPGGDVKRAILRSGPTSTTRSQVRAPSACRCGEGPGCRCPETRTPRHVSRSPVVMPGTGVLPQAP